MAVSKQNCLVNIIFLTVRHIGLWHTEKKHKYHPLALLAIFCYFSSYAFQMIALVLSRNDTNRLFECFSVISFCGMGLLKLLSLCHKRDHWLKLLERMKDLEHWHLRDEDLHEVEYQSYNEEDNSHVAGLIRNYTKKFKKTSTILFNIYCFTGVIFMFAPFIEYAFALFQGEKPEQYPHILPSWNPFDNVHFLCYVVTVVCEAVAAIYCVFVHITFDITFIGVVVFVCGQFSSLVYQSEQIGGRGKLNSLSKRRETRAHFRIIKCHRIHIQLIRSINELDKLLKDILGFYFFLSTLTLCSVAVRLKSEKHGVMQLVSLLQYMCSTLTQLYIYCSYGDNIYNESAIKAGEGPFGAAVWCLSPKIRRELLVLGMGMMKPKKLHAGPFNTVDLPSFVKIVRAAYSYYAVISNSKQ